MLSLRVQNWLKYDHHVSVPGWRELIKDHIENKESIYCCVNAVLWSSQWSSGHLLPEKKHSSAPRGAQSMLPAPPQALFRFKQACHVCRYLPWEALPWAYRSLWATRPKGFDQNKWRNEIIKSPLSWPSPFPCSSVLGRRGLSFPPGYQNSPALLQCCYSWDEAAKLDWSQGCQVSG